MFRLRSMRRWVLIVPVIVVAFALAASLALAQAPQPGAPAPGSTFAKDVQELDMTAPGAAATIHGNPVGGRAIYVQNCVACHGPRGLGGLPNPGSDDGSVPALNPADPGFLGDHPGDPAVFAHNIDLFMQHGSRPEGDDPKLVMPSWGDQKKLTQQQIADAEAYIMQLNGVYWPDEWAPPLELQGQATRDGDTITYQVLLVNQGSSGITNLLVRDTLPVGLTYVTSYVPGPGQNPGHWNGSTVQWDHGGGVPQGGTLGPFVIVVKAQGAAVPPNTVEAQFSWSGIDGSQHTATAISGPMVPAAPQPAATAAASRPVASTTLTKTTTTAPATRAPITPTTAATTAPAASTPVTPTATTAPTPAATATPAPAATSAPTGDAAAGQALFTTKTCTACHMVGGKGGTIGPDLSHIATTPYDSMANDPAFLAKWLANPPAVKPGTSMPKVDLTDTEINNLVAYLLTLK